MSRPILQTQFFKAHGPKRDFYRRFQNHYAWNQQVLPVYEWEGLLYVASDLSDLLDSPPKEWPSHWVLVEALSSDLENLWTEFTEVSLTNESSVHTANPTAALDLKSENSAKLELPDLSDPSEAAPSLAELSEVSEIPEIPDLPEIPDVPEIPSIPDLPVIPDDHEFEIVSEDSPASDDLHSAVSQLTPPPKVSAKDKALDLPPATAKPTQASMDDLESLMNASVETEADPENPFEEKSEEKPEALDGLIADIGPVRLAKVIAPAETEQIVSPIPELPIIPDDQAMGEVSEDTLPPQPRANFLKKTAPSQEPVAIRREIDELTPTPPPVVPTPEKNVQAVAQTPPKEAASVKSSTNSGVRSGSQIDYIPNEERLLLDQLPKSYSRGFLAVKAGNSMRLVSWPKDLTAELSSKEKDFSLNTPSPFRIALRTEKPYHGYLIQTPFMTQALATLNAGAYPETLTVVPVKFEQNIVAFVICMGTKEAEKKTGLQAVEKVATTLGEKWGRLGAQFIKAA